MGIHTAWNGNDADFEHVRQKRQRDNARVEWDDGTVGQCLDTLAENEYDDYGFFSACSSIAIELNVLYNFTIA